MKKEFDKGKLVTVGIIAFLIIVFVVGFTYGLNKVLAMEGAFPPVLNEQSKSEPAKSSAEALKYLDSALNYAIKEKPALSIDETFGIKDGDGESINVTGSEELKNTVIFLKGDVENILEDKFEDYSSDYFTAIDKKVSLPDITEAQLGEFEVKYFHYTCPSCGEESDEALESCENCGSIFPYNMVYNDEYEYTLHINVKEKAPECFSVRTDEQIKALFGDTVNGKADINNLNVDYRDYAVYFKVNRLTDEINYLEYKKVAGVSADIEFTGDYKDVKGGSVSFVIEDKMKYDFSWPSLTLSDIEKTVEPNETDNLLATLNCDDPTKYSVTWTSSDESVLTVDEEGYYKACNKDGGFSVITASFTFGGKTYTDSCTVYVRYPVESMVLNHRKAKLNVGETIELSPGFTPEKATVKSVKWYSEDESVATVDIKGTVTAVGKGEVKVYALSDDGYFKSSCEVTVK